MFPSFSRGSIASGLVAMARSSNGTIRVGATRSSHAGADHAMPLMALAGFRKSGELFDGVGVHGAADLGQAG
jgi:hypothetical protein